MIGLIGKKVGMTQLFDEKGEAIPVTVIEAGPCPSRRCAPLERDGYAAVQLGFGDQQGDALHAPGARASSRSATCRRRATLRSSASRTWTASRSGRADRRRCSRRASTSTCRASPRAAASGRGQAPRLRRRPRLARPDARQAAGLDRRVGVSVARRQGQAPAGPHGRRARSRPRTSRSSAIDAEQNVLLVRGAVPGPAERPRASIRKRND